MVTYRYNTLNILFGKEHIGNTGSTSTVILKRTSWPRIYHCRSVLIWYKDDPRSVLVLIWPSTRSRPVLNLSNDKWAWPRPQSSLERARVADYRRFHRYTRLRLKLNRDWRTWKHANRVSCHYRLPGSIFYALDFENIYDKNSSLF